jgi:hypothetical protein
MVYGTTDSMSKRQAASRSQACLGYGISYDAVIRRRAKLGNLPSRIRAYLPPETLKPFLRKSKTT